ncbi:MULTISPECIES: sensor histidine kinase [Rhodanobacter]|uniref:sensor histidine kinase n=1 Tax=Rhodanobacter TaxID=75309 RepID=UPI000260C834|nr:MULTISPECIES: sensor histidine kinase [Rhodanobacter]EIM01112.1 integral membrane sensor signal transduction histidine kinase [Rhodanobacter denitrificans]KZC19110.1 two-component sensor histidine kinase [Rhodanobacter denitrificans]UJJ52114.1 sensor histidine kinase [Rhodanobacter denitrificans]UJM89570.1 sensor histidine kinase [Rhodanobacter denitrificans]UJM94860.1 sensor histidine kinase [Rhodanobacter denitrificans]
MIPAFIARWFVPAPDSAVADDLRRGKSPWADSVHLLWSLWIFITPLFDHGLRGYTSTWLLCTLGSYPLFLLLFARLRLASRRTAHRYAWGMAVLCFGLLRWYPSGLSYFVYACVMLSHCELRHFRSYVIQVVLLNVVYVALAWWIGYPQALLVIMPVTVFVICTIVTVEQIHQEKDAALSLSHDEVRRLAATAERERIGRDLHDLLGHTLSLITLKLELSRKLFDRDVDAARREVEEAEKVARHALAEVRCAVTGIRATDLAAELASARLLLESSRVHLDYGELPADLPGEIERGLSLVLREAVTNIARHADASQARIELARERNSVCLRISDNGRGGIESDGNGLSGMRERVRALGGTLAFESPRGQGSRLRVVVPLPIVRLVESSRSAPDPSMAGPLTQPVTDRPVA